MVSLKTIKKRLKSGPKSTGCNTITPVNSDQNDIRGTENPACDIWASETDFDSVEKIDSTTHRQLSLPEVKSTTHNELDIKGNFLQESHQGYTDKNRSARDRLTKRSHVGPMSFHNSKRAFRKMSATSMLATETECVGDNFGMLVTNLIRLKIANIKKSPP